MLVVSMNRQKKTRAATTRLRAVVVADPPQAGRETKSAARKSAASKKSATTKSAAAARSAATATYVYCMVKASPGAGARPPRAPKGLEGTAKLRELAAGDGYTLLVAEAPLDLYDAAAIDAKLRDLDWVGRRAVEHEAVVEYATKLGTVIPMKLFTIFSNDERALAHVSKMRRSLDRVVERIAGCEEWGLRVFFDEARAARSAASASDAGRRAATGREFLLRKKALDDERRTSSARLATEVDALYERVAKTARQAQRRPVPAQELAGRVLLDAVFLVPKSSVTKIKAAVSSSADKLVELGFDLTLSGPWPAYSFIGGT
jgi:hypothetical protein